MITCNFVARVSAPTCAVVPSSNLSAFVSAMQSIAWSPRQSCTRVPEQAIIMSELDDMERELALLEAGGFLDLGSNRTPPPL